MGVESLFMEIFDHYTYVEIKSDKKTDKKAEKPLNWLLVMCYGLCSGFRQTVSVSFEKETK